MNKFEQAPDNTERFFSSSEGVENIALQISEMQEFQDAVGSADDKLAAIREVRILLQTNFPEISNLTEPEQPEEEVPDPQKSIRRRRLTPSASPNFIVAKNIVDLLYEE